MCVLPCAWLDRDPADTRLPVRAGYDKDWLELMHSQEIIPTRRKKSKVPKTHTYPLGAKMISEALTGVPQFEELTIIFHFLNPMLRFQKTSTQYQVLEVS